MALCWAVTSAQAGFPFVVTSGSTGTVSGGSWTGSGTIAPNITPGTTSATNSKIFVNDFGSGTLQISPGSLYPNTANVANLNDVNRVTSSTGVSHVITINGGTADLLLANTNNFDGGADKFNSVGLSGFSPGVTSISWTMTYTLPIAGRTSSPTQLDSRPMGGALGLAATGGLALNNFNVDLELENMYSTPVANGVFVSGIPALARPYASTSWGTTTGGQTTFHSDGFTGLVPPGELSNNFLLVRGYDYNGSGNGFTAADAPLVYTQSYTWTISLDSGTFAAGTQFVMSLDGQQFTNLNNVPEPTLIGLAAMGVGILVFVRRRRVQA